jgi:hypothetical protein
MKQYLFLFFVIGCLIMPVGSAITYSSGVRWINSGGNVKFTTSSSLVLNSWLLDNNNFCMNGLGFHVDSTTSTLINVSSISGDVYYPVANGRIVGFTAFSTGKDYFNLTGLRVLYTYNLSVDGLNSSVMTDYLGHYGWNYNLLGVTKTFVLYDATPSSPGPVPVNYIDVDTTVASSNYGWCGYYSNTISTMGQMFLQTPGNIAYSGGFVDSGWLTYTGLGKQVDRGVIIFNTNWVSSGDFVSAKIRLRGTTDVGPETSYRLGYYPMGHGNTIDQSDYKLTNTINQAIWADGSTYEVDIPLVALNTDGYSAFSIRCREDVYLGQGYSFPENSGRLADWTNFELVVTERKTAPEVGTYAPPDGTAYDAMHMLYANVDGKTSPGYGLCVLSSNWSGSWVNYSSAYVYDYGSVNLQYIHEFTVAGNYYWRVKTRLEDYAVSNEYNYRFHINGPVPPTYDLYASLNTNETVFYQNDNLPVHTYMNFEEFMRPGLHHIFWITDGLNYTVDLFGSDDYHILPLGHSYYDVALNFATDTSAGLWHLHAGYYLTDSHNKFNVTSVAFTVLPRSALGYRIQHTKFAYSLTEPVVAVISSPFGETCYINIICENNGTLMYNTTFINYNPLFDAQLSLRVLPAGAYHLVIRDHLKVFKNSSSGFLVRAVGIPDDFFIFTQHEDNIFDLNETIYLCVHRTVGTVNYDIVIHGPDGGKIVETTSTTNWYNLTLPGGVYGLIMLNGTYRVDAFAYNDEGTEYGSFINIIINNPSTPPPGPGPGDEESYGFFVIFAGIGVIIAFAVAPIFIFRKFKNFDRYAVFICAVFGLMGLVIAIWFGALPFWVSFMVALVIVGILGLKIYEKVVR